MGGGKEMIMPNRQVDHEPYHTEINESGNLSNLRGIKRQRIACGVGITQGRSFLETKWEMESLSRRRKNIFHI